MTRFGSRVLDSERAARFEAMFDQHAGRVYAYAARRSTPDVANEVVSETFLIAWRKLDAVPADPLPWLLNVTRKVLANRRRSDQRRETFTTERARALRAEPTFDRFDFDQFLPRRSRRRFRFAHTGSRRRRFGFCLQWQKFLRRRDHFSSCDLLDLWRGERHHPGRTSGLLCDGP